MFYSQLLLSKKGALGTVWVAAHCYNKLKKKQVQETDIPSSVDKILVDEVPVVAHRILAYLLLGVVRIYSKKVEYLFHDCNDVFNKLCEIKIGKRTQASSSASRPHKHSISLPKRFELDAFDLGLLEDQVSGGKNVRPREEVTLADGRRKEGSTSGFPRDKNVRPREEVTLADGREREGSTSGLLNEENMSSSEAYSTGYTPPRDVLSHHHMDQDHLMSPSHNMNKSTESVEILRGTTFALKDRMEPMMLDEAEEEEMHDKPSNMDQTNLHWLTHDMDQDSFPIPSHIRIDSVASLNIFHGTGFSLEDRLEPMELDEAEEEQMNGMPSNSNLRTDLPGQTHGLDFDSVASSSRANNPLVASLETIHDSDKSLEHCGDPVSIKQNPRPPILEVYRRKRKTGCLDDIGQEKVADVFKTPSEADEPRNLHVSVDKEQPVRAKKMKFPEMITPESRISQRKEHFVSISVDVTPDTKLAEAGAVTPDFSMIQTPALQERAKISKKRKALLDHSMMVPANAYKDWINDPRDLKRRRGTVPHTALQIWRAHKLCNIPQSFLEPSVPSITIDLHSLERKKKTRAPSFEPTKSVACQDEAPVAHEGPEKTLEVRSSITHEDEIPDVISAEDKIPDVRSPVGQRSPEQTLIAPGTPVTMHFNSLRSHETEALADSDILVPTSSLEITEKRPSPSEELELDEINSFEGDSLEKDTFSARTRMTAIYLLKKFSDKKRRKEDEVLNLLQLLVGKTKKESARLFYETLVLKTRDCVDVQQEKAYSDILLRQTSKLEAGLKFN